MKKKAWIAFSKYIRLRDAIKTTGTTESVKCCTCNGIFPAFGKGCAQAGHFIPGRRNSVLFDERLVHAQCAGCNIWGRGKLPEYEEFMRRTYGEKVLKELWEKSRTLIQYKKSDYQEIEKKYKRKFEELWMT